MLGMYPDVQEKAYRESVEALTPDGSIDHTDLANLKYIERCVYETMRLYPIGPIIGRQFDENLEIGKFQCSSKPFINDLVRKASILNFRNSFACL